MPKNITSEVREIILKVKEFMDEEKRMQVPIIPLSKVYVRVSAATGVSERTVLNIVKEARLIEQGLLDPETLKKNPKKRVRTKGKIEVDEYDLQESCLKLITSDKQLMMEQHLKSNVHPIMIFKGS
ncbi:unnamed protein product [Pieris brassicae]|uniref:Uncharacterized protein n=1 Tax=Pieris brassicae TaxID=7116 RepID=A0A9P0U426_PIEBR|nr:unnamed protein product [Pieris brassicae]